MTTPAQAVPRILLQLNQWQADGKMTKEEGQKLNALTLNYHPDVLALADGIGKTPDDELLARARELSQTATLPSSSSNASSSSASSSGSHAARRGPRPALNIGTVKDANATPEAAQADAQESQADALLKAKRERALKRQSMPEKLPQSVTDQVQQR